MAKAGFWSFDRSKTRLTSGFAADKNTRALLVVEKDSHSLGAVTTGIKEGGSIKGIVGYKAKKADTPFDAKSGVLDFAWVEAGKGEEPKPDGDGGKKDENDWASSLSLGVSFLAAVSALAF